MDENLNLRDPGERRSAARRLGLPEDADATTIRAAMQRNADTTVNLWRFPPEDFEEWREFVGAPRSRFGKYEHYIAELQGAAEQARTRGMQVEFIPLNVSTMKRILEQHGLDNNAENRAQIIAAGYGMMPDETVLGLKIGPNYVGSALVRGPELLASGETEGRSKDAIDEALSHRPADE